MGCLKLSYYQNFYLSQRRPFRKIEDQEKTCVSLLYFGARYYNSDISVWLSVDPLADKYPSQSPYSYVGNRPINVIDPNGEDEWEVDNKGNVNWVCESETHTLYSIDRSKKRTGTSTTVSDRSILDQLANGSADLSVALGGEDSQDDMINVFLYMAENTEVEWRVDRYINEDGDNAYSIGTNHDFYAQAYQSSPTALQMGHSQESTVAFLHSHPSANKDREISSMGFNVLGNGNLELTGDSYNVHFEAEFKNTSYYTYFPQSNSLYLVRGDMSPQYIKQIDNYKDFFFGVINTK